MDALMKKVLLVNFDEEYLFRKKNLILFIQIRF